MKHIFITLIFFVSLFGQNTVAILDFEGINVSTDEARALSNRFGSEFLNLSGGEFTLVERQQMGEILEEQGLQQSGCVSSECAVEVGAALGAKFIITGSISKVGSLYSVNARFLNVETAEIIRSVSHDQMGTIMTLMTEGMKETAAKLLGISTPSSAARVPAKGSMRYVATEQGISLYNPDTGRWLEAAPTTPKIVKDVDPGVYRFLAKKNGFKDKIFEVEIFAGRESNLTISSLEKATGVVTVSVNEKSANVYLLHTSGEYRLLGEAPVTTGPLTYNDNHSIKVTKDGYDEVIKYFSIDSPTEDISVVLKRTLPTLTINTTPLDATLSINYTKYYQDGSSSNIFSLDPGGQTILVEKPGFVTQTDFINLDYGDNKELNFNLVRAVADIQFNVNVDDYTITQNNKSLMGQIEENTLSDVPFGFHNYLVTAKKYEALNVDVNVQNTETIFQNLSLVKKSRSKALRKSLLLPGSGQFYAENKGKGILMMGLHLGAGYLIYDNYTKYNDSIALKDEYYLKYKSATDLNQIAQDFSEYEKHVKSTNDAAGMLMAIGATFAINWAFSAVDAFLFNGLE